MAETWTRKANKQFYEIGKKYWPYIPIKEIETVLNTCGDTYLLQEDGERFQGFFCGREGRADFPLHNSRKFLHMTWYKREETGNYEIVVYVN